jgi:TetR/AcrR family transcriptional repressor of nem operon
MGRVSDARDRLIDAAVELVWLRSYGGVSVDDLCERAGVKKGSFYHFFATKDDLVLAALDASWSARKPVLDELFAPTRPPMDRLVAYFENVYARQKQLKQRFGRTVGCPYVSVGTECAQSHPTIAQKAQEILAHYVAYYEGALRDAKASGDLRVADPAHAARALFAFMEGALGQARIADDPEPLRDLVRDALRFLGADVSARPPRRKASGA